MVEIMKPERKIRPANPYAKELASDRYHQRVIRNKRNEEIEDIDLKEAMEELLDSHE